MIGLMTVGTNNLTICVKHSHLKLYLRGREGGGKEREKRAGYWSMDTEITPIGWFTSQMLQALGLEWAEARG